MSKAHFSPVILTLLFLSGAAWVVVDVHQRELRHSHELIARSLLRQLAQAVAVYELDYAAYPPGDGTGSESLMRALQSTHPKPCGYFELPPEEFLSPGDFRFYYRSPGLHNPKSFDLWCEDGEGRADGINNWGGSP